MIRTTFTKPTLLATAFVALGSLVGGAQAATTQATFDVKIRINNVCNVATAGAEDMDFGTHISTDTNIQQASTITLTCTPGATYDVGLDGGGSTDINARIMQGQAVGNLDTVGYQLYTDAARSVVWGNTVSTDTVGGTGTGVAQVLDVYGEVTSANVSADDYLDTVTVTVTY